MSYPHKSGCQKRKERVEREEKFLKSQKGQSTLSAFKFCAKEKPTQVTQNIETKNPAVEESDTVVVDYSGKPECLPEVNDDIICTEKQSNSQSLTNTYNYHYDIGTLTTNILQTQLIENIIRQGHQKMPTSFPRDRLNEPFPLSLLSKTLPNSEKVKRDWLVWSHIKNAFYCFPCRLFKISTLNCSYLSSPDGYSKDKIWRKLYERLPSHENNKDHIQCFVKWREVEIRIKNDSSIDKLVCKQIAHEAQKWRDILTRVLDTILFLGERGLALRGESHIVGEPNNGNFLGILELISHYDPILRQHLEKVKKSQQLHQRLQVHYLSAEIQNEFISLCADHVMSVILIERSSAKYYTIIVDATPDSAHVEQTTFILRYLHFEAKEKIYDIKERFLAFVDCNKKTGEAIADLIRETLKKYNILLTDCRGQGYDNGSNMKGEYNGAQSHILKDNPYAIYSPCAAHSLNLCGVDSAECCTKAITFFGVVQKCYNVFSSSPQRWEILKKNISGSLHGLSNTRWSARIDAVKPFVNNLPGLQNALEDVKQLNLTAESRRDIEGIVKYINKFECIVMASIWFKVLCIINERNVVLQARNSTIDVEVINLESLIADLQLIRNNWNTILQECKIVASGLKNTSSELQVSRKRKRVKVFSKNNEEECMITDEETDFKRETFFVIIDSVIAGINNRFVAIKKLNDIFSFLWQFVAWSEERIQDTAANFVKKYDTDVSQELITEMIHLKHIYKENFTTNCSPYELLNEITSKNLDTLFPNVCVALRIFCTLPVSVASAERSFSVLARIKNFHRSCSSQSRVSGLGTLCLESGLARQLDFKEIIDCFASAKARKAKL